MSNILIIEDEKNLARFVELELKHEGYNAEVHYNGRTGLDAALNNEWDAILLDLMLPELNGLEVCRRVRQAKNTPIIMMTARDSVIDRVSGLDHGADDYIVKPFAIEELLARLRALLRRIDIEGDKNVAKQTTITYRDLTIEKENRVVRRGNEVIELTKREYELLLTLMENVNVVLARDVLLNKVWGYETEVETNVVDVYIRYLRNKIDVPGEERYSNSTWDWLRDALVSHYNQTEKRELKGPSLTIKWAFASSFFIFVVFTIFAVITYKSSINLIVAKERANVEHTISEAASRLSNSDEELTLINAYRNLTNADQAGGTGDDTAVIEGNLMKIDSFISELGQASMDLYVYDLDEKLIFKTHEKRDRKSVV